MRKTLALTLAILLFLNLNAFAESLPVFDSLLDARDYLNEQALACPTPISIPARPSRRVPAASAGSTAPIPVWTATW